MTRLLIYCAAMLVLTVGALRAQGHVEVIDNVTFSSDAQNEPARVLTYGFGSDYTDSVDFDKGEQIIPPFFPPDGFYVYFARNDGQGGEDFMTKDVRGVPDSVANGGHNFFSQSYLIRIQRYVGQNVSITVQFPLLRGVDSVVFESTQAGANFRAVFTGADKVLIPNPLIQTLLMTVYYDYDRAASVPVPAASTVPALAVIPNPVVGTGDVTLSGNFPAGSRLVLGTMRGEVVAERRVDEACSIQHLDVTGLPSGAYIARIVGRDGATVGTGRFVLSN